MLARGWSRSIAAQFAVLCVLSIATSASAQLRRATSPVWQPPVSIVAPDDALAVSVNPSALAYLRSWSAVYVHAEGEDRTGLAERGDGIYAATPLLLGFSLGASVDSVRPTSASGGIEHTMLSLALAYAYDDAISVGAATRFLWSPNPGLAELFTLDLAASWRPLPYVALSFLARDVTGPGYHGGGGYVPRSFLLGLAVRPTGTRTLTLDLTGAVDEDGRVGARLSGEVEVPWIGRIQAAAEVERVGDEQPDARVTAGVIVDWGQVGAGGGVVLGDGFDDSPGWYVTARVEGNERTGVPTGAYVADVVLADLGARSMLRVSRRLERALHDPRIHGVVLRPQGSDIGLAYAQELRLLIDALQDAGKPVVCILGDASGAEIYACAGARTVLADPAGGVRLYGPSIEITHLAGLLQLVGIRADFVRIGPYKSAIEDYQDMRSSEAARVARDENLDDLYGRFVWDLSRDLEVEPARVREIVDGGPYVTDTAIAMGLVDGSADPFDAGDALAEAFGGHYGRERHEPDLPRERWGREPRVGVVVVDGEMVDGDNVDIPILEIHATGGRTAVREIERMAADPAIGAIVVRVDSPGGSVLAADQIWRAIRRARERKPVIASMGAVAASGGYFVASACDEIWADPATLTGSIGVWFGKVDVEPLAERLGVETEFFSRGAHAGAESLWRPFTPDERAILSEMVRRWYRDFLRRVAEGRGMRMTEVDAVARGRVWTGDRALELGLVDRLGGFRSALVRARQLGGLPHDVDFEIAPSRPSSLLDYVLGDTPLGRAMAGASAEGASSAESEALEVIAPELLSALRAAWVIRAEQGARTPVARMPLEIAY
ncbi:signal peptide peptidase SppA [Sandaracinus amylolyticus]|uniref:signal peptide peptidase SppA n=1 Tax=Sandaracinus amylolyticus TaxID=927083 RepID=UPI001F01F87A|nr:signal peptide peptidase SppA [Sandaracinus amylolyticus]